MRFARAIVVAALTALTLFFFACTETKTKEAGLALVIATNLTTPADLDGFELEVRQETEPGKYDSVLIQNRFGIPLEAQLPATFTIGAGESPRQNAYIRLTGRRGDQAIVLREVKIQVPKNRVAALTLVLAAACVNHLKVDETGAAQTDCANVEESCQPETGQCGPTLLDVNLLPDFDPDVQLAEAGAIPIVKLDAGTAPVTVDAGVDAAPIDGGPPKSASKEITKLTIENVEGTIAGDVITVLLPPNANLAALSPNITTTGAAVSPASGSPQNFTSGPVKYTVTAEDGSTREYIVVVQLTGTDAKKILTFELPQGSTVISGTTITVTVPHGTNVALMSPAITFEGKTVSPAPGAPQNFTNPFPYKVTAYDGSTVIYTVKVVVAAASDKDITEFSIQGTPGTIVGTNITVVVPGGANIAALSPKVVITGKSVSPASFATQNFTNPVMYTVTAADNSTKVYTASVTALPKTSKSITSFVINGVAGSISGANISVVLPPGSNLSALAPLITHTGASISPGNGQPQDFTSPRPYVVTAEDGSKQTYTVTVTAVPGSNAKDITDFVVNGVHASFSGPNGFVVLTGPSNLLGLTPTITVSPDATVSPPSGSPQDFDAGPVTYTVTAQNGSQQQYFITVSKPTAAKPQFTPASPLTQDAPFTVNITSATATAVIHYTVDGSLPDETSPTTLPVSIGSANIVLRAIAIANGYLSNQSDPGFYSVQVAPPVFTPTSGLYNNKIVGLVISTPTSGATVCTTTSFAAPPACNASGGCAAGTPYRGALTVDSPGPGLVQELASIACKAGLADSIVSNASYQWKVADPIYDKAPGHYPHGTVVNISTATQPEDAKPVSLVYTKDGSDPLCYDAAGGAGHGISVPDDFFSYTLTATEGNVSFKVRGCRDDYLPSAVSVSSYQVP